MWILKCWSHMLKSNPNWKGNSMYDGCCSGDGPVGNLCGKWSPHPLCKLSIYKDPANEGISMGKRMYLVPFGGAMGCWRVLVGFSEVESPKGFWGWFWHVRRSHFSLANQRNVQMCSTFVGFDSLIFLEDLDFSAASASKSEAVFYFLPTVDNQDIQQRSGWCLSH